MAADGLTFKPCSACKKPIGYGEMYYVCNVSTCNRKRTALRFCSVSCWEVHLPVARHREAWAEERTAPTAAEAARAAATERSSKPPATRSSRRVIVGQQAPRASSSPTPVARPTDAPDEVLIVASRLKDYVKAISGFNTSDRVLDSLSEHVRRIVRRAVDNARTEGRKTILDRDIPGP